MTRLATVISRTDFVPCRLCGGTTSFRFANRVLRKWAVRYWHCDDCGSLQTDAPHWLEEAYANVRPVLDTGMVARTLHMAQSTSLVLRLAGVAADAACVDWGGGNGLFTRMMRDQGFDFRSYDKFAEPFYCVGFVAEPKAGRRADVVTSFEVFEHLAEPRDELAQILALQPDLWILSTQLYRAQGADWDYLASDTGRHVFFYSARALCELGARNGLEFVEGRHLHAFVRKGAHGAFARRAIRRVLRGDKLAVLAGAVSFQLRQRRAHLRWQADRDALRAGIRRP